MGHILLTTNEEFALFGAIAPRIRQLEKYIKTRTDLIENGLADPDDTFMKTAKMEIETLNCVLEKMGF